MVKKIICAVLVALFLSSQAFGLTPPDINAASAIIIEKSTGDVLYELNPDMHRPPASITKIMTAIIVLENNDVNDPDNIVTVSANALKGLAELNSLTHFLVGEEIHILDLLRYILIASGNDACNAIAEHTFGSIDAFVTQMNAKAKELGCTNTNFVNTHGLTQDGHYTSARDVAYMAMHAMNIPLFAQIVSETEVTVPPTNKHSEVKKYTTNHLLSNQSQSGYRYDGAMGIKTGHTTPAGYCLASAVQKDDLTFYTVVLGAEKAEDGKLGSFTETIKLFDFAKNNFSTQVMLSSTEPITTIPVRLGETKDEVTLQPEHSITALLPKDYDSKTLELTITADESVDAPVEQGQVLGTLAVRYNGRDYGSMNLIAAEDIARSQALYVIDRITSFVSGTTFKIIVGSVILFIALFVLYVVIVNRRRQKKRRKYGGNRYR